MNTNVWGALWKEKKKKEGAREFLLRRNRVPVLFKTRHEARCWIETNYGYIKTRKDLRAEPHGWRLPVPVKVSVIHAGGN